MVLVYEFCKIDDRFIDRLSSSPTQGVFATIAIRTVFVCCSYSHQLLAPLPTGYPTGKAPRLSHEAY
jgi:hypothetical protein